MISDIGVFLLMFRSVLDGCFFKSIPRTNKPGGKDNRGEKVRLRKERKAEKKGTGVFPQCKPVSIYRIFSDHPGSMLGMATQADQP